jgi:hypothetical protein
VEPGTNAVIDVITFHSFQGLTIVLGGLNQVPASITHPNHGMFLVADNLYQEGYDVYKYDEDEVGSSWGPGPGGEGIVYDVIASAINDRMVTDLVIMGYSQGGGSTYNLSVLLNQRRQQGHLGAYNLAFTAYIDAVSDQSNLAETRLPIGTMWHLNLYQLSDEPFDVDPLELDGDTVTGSAEQYNVETQLPFLLDAITHFDIDQNSLVTEWLEMRYRQNATR